jgi:hypothetical protein
VGEQPVKLDNRVVVMVSPVFWEMEAGRAASTKFLVHSSGFLALHEKHPVSVFQKSASMVLKFVEYAPDCRFDSATHMLAPSKQPTILMAATAPKTFMFELVLMTGYAIRNPGSTSSSA